MPGSRSSAKSSASVCPLRWVALFPVQRIARIRRCAGFGHAFAGGEVGGFEFAALVFGLVDPMVQGGAQPLQDGAMFGGVNEVARFMGIGFEIVEFLRGHVGGAE